MSDLSITLLLIVGAVPHPGQRCVDRPHAVGRGVDRHAAVQLAARRRRDGRHHLGQCLELDADRAAAVRLDGRDPVPHAAERTTCSAAWRRGCRPLPGRLLHVNVVGCTIFAAVSGSSAATCATIGKMSLPELARRGYPDRHRRRFAGRRRHAGPADPAVDHHDRLRRHRRGVDRAAVHRRRAARPDAGAAVLRLPGRLGAAQSRRWCRRPTRR